MPIKDPILKREYARKWVAARRAMFFNDKCCAKCGASEGLELDHINPETKIHHCIWSWSKERRDAEILKCQVLCKSCHKDKTIKQLSKPLTHGFRTGYNRGCRCRPCTDAQLAYVYAWRKRHGRRQVKISQQSISI